jgi:ribonuclease P protein component
MLRLRSAKDIERVWREGHSHAHPLAVLITCRRIAETGDHFLATRCGFIAGKKVGSAVTRNRAKRLLREAVRVRSEAVAEGWDLIFVARPPLANASLGDVQTAVSQLLKRANVVHL